MVRLASAAVTLTLALASDVARGCTFCGDGWSYDLSTLSTETFVVHDGIPTEKGDTYAYLVTSPCGSVSTDICIAGPTSDPIAMPNVLPANVRSPSQMTRSIVRDTIDGCKTTQLLSTMLA